MCEKYDMLQICNRNRKALSLKNEVNCNKGIKLCWDEIISCHLMLSILTYFDQCFAKIDR